ncbi:MAG: hypothetical protein QOG00_519 [Pyrinomonadaceae bacterium]|nr:hypothetical protein [Pyrinomonadaceae bacterium]
MTLILIVSVTAMICVYTRAASKESGGEAVATAEAQRASGRAPQRRRPQTRRAAPAVARVDYSDFSHGTKGHFENCAACHLIPSFEKPDVGKYPDHPACINCHRREFFRGARPAICSNCHSITSPASKAVFDFPKKNEDSQFGNIFSHFKHFKSTTITMFQRLADAEGRKVKVTFQVTCIHCHKVDTQARTPPAGAPKDARPFRAGTFMTTPSSHATCFICHWKKDVENRDIPPFADNCRGCHKNLREPLTPTAAVTTATNAPPASQPSVPKIVPAVARAAAQTNAQGIRPAHETLAVRRISPRFVHILRPDKIDDDRHRKKFNDGKLVDITCASCHTAVRKADTLAAMRQKGNRVEGNLVQLVPSCSTSACHAALTESEPTWKASVYRELLERSANPKFNCVYCHASPESSNTDISCNHFKAVIESAEKAGKKAEVMTSIGKLIPARCAEAPKKEGN